MKKTSPYQKGEVTSFSFPISLEDFLLLSKISRKLSISSNIRRTITTQTPAFKIVSITKDPINKWVWMRAVNV